MPNKQFKYTSRTLVSFTVDWKIFCQYVFHVFAQNSFSVPFKKAYLFVDALKFHLFAWSPPVHLRRCLSARLRSDLCDNTRCLALAYGLQLSRGQVTYKCDWSEKIYETVTGQSVTHPPATIPFRGWKGEMTPYGEDTTVYTKQLWSLCIHVLWRRSMQNCSLQDT